MTTYYPNDPIRDAACKAYLRDLRRRARYVPPRRKYLAHGGPYDGQTLMLDPTFAAEWNPASAKYRGYGVATTAVIRVGNHVGRYIEVPEHDWAAMNLLTRRPRGVNKQLVWQNETVGFGGEVL